MTKLEIVGGESQDGKDLDEKPPRDNELEDDKVGRRVGRKETESGLRELKTV